MPEGVERLERARDLLRHGQSPQAVKLDHDVHLLAHRIANLAKGFERQVKVGVADVLAVAFFGSRVKRPDLHAGDALRQQRLGQFAGAVEKTLQVFVRAG